MNATTSTLARLEGLFACVALAALAGCWGGGGDNAAPAPSSSSNAPPSPAPSPPPPSGSVTVGGTASGLAGGKLVLQNNGSDDLVVSADGAFTFPTAVASGAAYAVTVKGQPAVPVQACTVSTGAGTANAAVTSVSVNCAAAAVPDRFLYAVEWSANAVYGQAIDPASGALTGALSGTPAVVAGAAPFDVAASRNGHFLYTANYQGNSVSVFAIAGDGGLSAIVGSPFTTTGLQEPTSLAVDPVVDFLYVNSFTASTIFGFAIDPATGVPSLVAGSPFSAPTMTMLFDPSGAFAYSLDQCGISCDILKFSVDASGALAFSNDLVDLVRISGGGTSANFGAMAPDGRFVYVSAGTQILAFSRDAGTGVMSASPVSSLGVTLLNDLVIHPSGQYLYAVNSNAGTVSVYSVDASSGALLGEVAGSPFATGPSPARARADASGRFVYVTNFGDGTVSGYAVDPGTGALAPLAGSPFAVGSVGTNRLTLVP